VQLTVREVAQLFGVSEKTVYRWVGQRKLPAYRVNEQLRFNRAELLEWASANKAQVSPELFAEPESAAAPAPSLVHALREGGIHYRVGGSDTRSVLQSVVEVMRLPEEVDRGFLLQVLLAREALQSTGIGDGIAIPHPRSPIVLHISRPSVTLCFLEKPVEFGSLDGQPVHALFTLVSPTARAHLQLLSRVAYALRDEDFRAQITRVASRDEILAAAAAVDYQVTSRGNLAAPAGA
jgi:nitrogen PTS system EIIA component